MDSRLAEVRRLLRIHINWLTVLLLGKELISKEDLAELEKYGKLSLGDEIGFIEKAFSLGKLSAVSTKADYASVTLDKLSRLEKKKFSNSEKLAIREAKLHADRYIQSLANEIAEAASERINDATTDLVNSVMTTMKDEIALAIEEKKTSKELAASLSNIFSSGLRKDWNRFATTELHRAKVRGAAMAIANKVDIYSKSDGMDSDVSVVPNMGACDDCRHLYLDDDGNPKVFKLKELVARGTNAAPSIKHTRNKQGLHSQWKAVMPPAHPNCYCTIVYVPPGMDWEDGKLKVKDQIRYTATLSKAVDTGSMSPVIKPPGPKSSQDKTTAVKPGNIPGVAAPDSQGSSQARTEKIGPREGFVDCPYGGGAECVKHGGNGAATHKMSGESMKAHQQYGANRTDATDVDGLTEKIMLAEDWKADEHSSEEVIRHLESSDIISAKSLKDVDVQSGVNRGAVKAYLEGNGPVLVKPSPAQDVSNEVTVSDLFHFFGSDRCPRAAYRSYNGKPSSAHPWLSNHTSAATKLVRDGKYPVNNDNNGGFIKAILDSSVDKAKTKEYFDELITMDILVNNNDRHNGNFMVTDDYSDVMAIDHGFSFRPSFHNYREGIHQGLNSLNMRVKPTEAILSRFKNTSFSDLSKAMGGKQEDWVAAQTYLRMRYLQKVNEEHGHLPYDIFASSKDLFDDVDFERNNSVDKFEDFVIDFIDKHSNDPTSSEYISSQYFRDLGVLQGSITIRDRGDQFRYEKIARVGKARKEATNRGEPDFVAGPLEKAHKPIHEKYKPQESELQKGIVETQKALHSTEMRKEELRKELDKYYGILTDKQREKQRELYAEYMTLQDELPFLQRDAEDATDALNKLQREYRGDLRYATAKVYADIVPPGHEKTFSRLNNIIDKLSKDKFAHNVSLSDYSKPGKPVTAADLQAKKKSFLSNILGRKGKSDG